VIILSYTSLGALVFMTIEGDGMRSLRSHFSSNNKNNNKEGPVVASTTPAATITPSASPSTKFSVQVAKNETIQRMWEITEKLNVLYEDKWTAAVAEEMDRFQKLVLEAIRARGLSRLEEEDDELYHRIQWTFPGAFLYSLTVITTIGNLINKLSA
jgi:hypothetical protein